MGTTLSLNKPRNLCPGSNKSNNGGFFRGVGEDLNILKILSQVCVASSEISIHVD